MSKTCQNCKWFKKDPNGAFGICSFPAPQWAYSPAEALYHLQCDNGAQTCLCFEEVEVTKTVEDN